MTTKLSQNLLSITAMNRAKQAESSENIPAIPQDLLKLKEISEKLNLRTRRPSVVQWKQIIENRKSRGQYVTSPKPQYLEVSSNNLDTDISSQHKVRGFTINNPEKEENSSSNKICPDGNGLQPITRIRRPAQIKSPMNNSAANCVTVCDVIESYSQSQQQTVESAAIQRTEVDGRIRNPTEAQNSDTTTRYKQINQAIDNLRRDLMLMRIEDNKLARKLLDIRSEMNVLRAQYSWLEHADMLDDVTFELLEEEELTRLIKACDLSSRKPDSLFANFSPLRSIGVNKMNLNSRRFSIR